MSMVDRRTRLRAIYDQLVPMLTVLDDCEEHHIAAILSTAVDTLATKLPQPPSSSSDVVS